MSNEMKWLDSEKQNLQAIEQRVNELVQKYGVEEVRCAICEADHYTLLGIKETLRTVVCNRCGHVYVNPRLSETALTDLYSMHYWEVDHPNNGNPNLGERTQFDYQNATHKLQRDVLNYKSSGSLLNVGCSNGAVVRRALEFGFHAIGLEPSEDVANFAKSAFGVEVIVGTIETELIAPESFDILLAHDVLEHVFDVASFIRECYEKLRIGGLLVLETPTTDSVNFHVHGINWSMSLPLEHINLFNQRNLIRKLESVGFHILDSICPHEENMVVRATK